VPEVEGTPGRLRTHRIWATLTQLTILVDVILHGVYIHEVAREHTLLRRIQVDPQSVTLDEANAADNATRAAAIWLIVVLILGGIFLIVWLYRLRTDAEVFDPDRNHLSRGWAIGGWFVPIANLVLPFLVMRDVIRSVRAYPDGSTREAALLPLTCVWWGLWVVGAIGARLVHLNTNGTIGQLNSTLHEVIVLVLVEAVAGVVALAVIEAFTRANRRRWAAQPPEYGGWVAR
jgi:heme/copper-type cytochrome/quinol oxidase subunit 2